MEVIRVNVFHRVRSLKFVGLSIPKIWLIVGHRIKWPGDHDLQPLRSLHILMCGSSYSIRIPSLKFIGLSIPKIWLIFNHGAPCRLRGCKN